MPEKFLLSHISFDSNNQPSIDVQVENSLEKLPLFELATPLVINTNKRYCTGWVDFDKKLAFPCPDGSVTDSKYETCIRCRNKTGFNPAFYNAAVVSKQQERINQTPHFVYLAYFGPQTIKVGITQESRGIRRLLEQGARMALKLETFSSALIARQYEEKIAKQCKFVENVTQHKKISLLNEAFDKSVARKRLEEAKRRIEAKLSVKFESPQIIETNDYYFREPVDLKNTINIPELTTVVGRVIASIGSTVITEHESRTLAYSLKKFVGYEFEKTSEAPALEMPSEQLGLF